MHSHAWITNGLTALVALAVVCAAGAAAHAPLRHVPENTIKFVVGAMIVAFGTFWTLEAMAGDVWPGGDWSLLALAAFYLLAGQALVAWMKDRRVAA